MGLRRGGKAHFPVKTCSTTTCIIPEANATRRRAVAPSLSPVETSSGFTKTCIEPESLIASQKTGS